MPGGAAHFRRETVGRVRYAGAGSGSVHDSGDAPRPQEQRTRFIGHKAAMDGGTDSQLITAVRQVLPVATLIETIPEDAWRPIPYWMDGPPTWPRQEWATPFRREPDAAPAAFVRRAEARARFPGWPYRQHYRMTPSSTGRDGDTLELAADHRTPSCRDRECHRDLKYGCGLNRSPRASFCANGAEWRTSRCWPSASGQVGKGGGEGGADPSAPRKASCRRRRSQMRRTLPARRAASLCIFPGAGPGGAVQPRPGPIAQGLPRSQS